MAAQHCALPVIHLTREEKKRLHLTRDHALPPKLRSQIGMNNVVLLDNEGGGFCGYHCLGVITYLVKHSYVSYRDIMKRLKDIAEEKLCAQNLRLSTGQRDDDIATQLEMYLKAPAHELESCEISWYLRDYGINVGVIGYYTNGPRREYQVEIPLYHPDNGIWVFFLNTQRSHWEVLVKKSKKDNVLCLAFTVEEGLNIIQNLNGVMPDEPKMDETIQAYGLVELEDAEEKRPDDEEEEPLIRPSQRKPPKESKEPKRRRLRPADDDDDLQLALVLSVSMVDQ